MICHIKELSDGSRLAFGRGKFDHWCIFLKKPDKKWRAPRDLECFNGLLRVAKKHGAANVYNDFVSIYNVTTAKFNKEIVAAITSLVEKYGEDALVVDLWFTTLYAAMVAEENKKNAILKKRIKRLGVHQLLVDKRTAKVAASFSKGKEAWMLDLLCSLKGF
ncbi:MAG: hypothetical protein JNL74_02060 [Fibrobacteres bacterium]|nr:hypothetical protein [Fibrobacterota bacterium]